MKTNTIIADYIDELDEGDEIDGFDTDPNIVFEIDPSDTSLQPAQNEAGSPIVCTVRQMSQETPILFQNDKSQNLKKRGRRPDSQNSKLKKIEAKNASKQKKNLTDD
ncbi:hypothetical protein BpHYR1_027079 [Brachionus plicatilis]|uniref:Uncharacterized protein n=1 Tax=Brachionus plicatilis TaxID=10195 RepID=A0A3M7QYR6_BRAPC|nr:hypothetical protein BpHYR1_027079 [Brachionus plicatilis]